MEITIAWWNVESFAHYEPGRRAELRWPNSQDAYEDKRDAIAQVVRDGVIHRGNPLVLGLGEITRSAAEDLRDRLLPGYTVESLDLGTKPDFAVALFYPTDAIYQQVRPFVVRHVPQGTRPMAVVDIVQGGHRVRVVASHWTARIDPGSGKVRSEIARQLSRYVWDYFEVSGMEQRHIVLMGDMNQEPYGMLERDLFAHRHRSRATRRSHYQDKHLSRKHLYNISWRFTGEHQPFTPGVPVGDNSAGTYYYKGRWHTYDHVIVDGSLLQEPVPFFDERHAKVVTHPLLLHEGAPKKFSWKAKGQFSGLSDHLPVIGTLHL